jgi:hypothetical protein
MKIQILSPVFVMRWWLLLLPLTGCTPLGWHAPSLDVYGSYFPAWLICLSAGVLCSVFVSLLLRIFGIRQFAFLGPLLPVSLILIFAIAIWFLFFAT